MELSLRFLLTTILALAIFAGCAETPTATPMPTPPATAISATPAPTLVIPTPTPTGAPTATPTPLPTATAALTLELSSGVGCRDDQVDINKAPKEALREIIHIDEVRSAELIELRPFASLDDLIRILGIGPSRLEDIKAQGLACVTY